MDIQKKPTLAEKQAVWAEQLPNFEAAYWLPSHFEFVVFDIDQGNYVIKEGLSPDFEDDATEIWHRVNTGWTMWKKAINFSKAQALPEVLENDCMINQTWFIKGTSTSALIKHAEEIYKAEVIAQNSKIQFGTDDNEHWFAHDVPFFGRVQIDRIEEHGLVEWDIFFNECWQGPFNTKSKCIRHLEECIQEMREEARDPTND